MSALSDFLGTSDTTTSSGGTKEQREAQRIALAEAERLLRAGLQPFEGQRVAGFDPFERLGQQQILDFAGRGGALERFATQARGGLGFFLSDDALDPERNPFLRATAEGATRPFTTALTEQILPNLRDAATLQAGATGRNTRASQQEVAAVRDVSRQAFDVTANIYSQAYQRGLNNRLRALGLAPGVAALGALPGQLTAAVGAQRRAMDQAKIDASIQAFWEAQGLDYAALQFFADIAFTPAGGTSTTSGGSSFFQQLLLAGAGGAAAGGTSAAVAA